MCAMHIVLSNWASCATATASELVLRLGCSKRCKCPSSNSQVALRSPPSPSQQQEEPLLLLLRLPEALQLQVLGMSTVKDCLSLSLSSRWSYREIWENTRLWHSLLIGLDAQRQDLGNLSAVQLQDKFRWEHFGIDILASGKEWIAENKCIGLQKAERAVRAMLLKDADVAEPVTRALCAIIGNASEQSGRCVPEKHMKALISVVTSRCEVFTMEQTMDLVCAHHQLIARSQPSKRVHQKTRFARSQTDSEAYLEKRKKKPPQPAFNDEVYGRLSLLLSDFA